MMSLRNELVHSQVKTNTNGKNNAFNFVAMAKPKMRPAKRLGRLSGEQVLPYALQKAQSDKVHIAVIGTSKHAR